LATHTLGVTHFFSSQVVRYANEHLRCKKELKIVPGATHLFEEPGALEQVARMAAEWFKEHLQAQPRASAASGR